MMTKTKNYNREKLVSNQMMKGPVNGRYAAGSTERSRQEFFQKHLDLIEEVLRRSPRASAAVGAVICKAALLYNRESALAFADALRAGTFSGQDDPVFLLWKYLLRKDQSTIQIYKTTVTAVRAYCEGRKLSVLREAKGDIADVLP
jgi:hypothetical protein